MTTKVGIFWKKIIDFEGLIMLIANASKISDVAIKWAIKMPGSIRVR